MPAPSSIAASLLALFAAFPPPLYPAVDTPDPRPGSIEHARAAFERAMEEKAEAEARELEEWLHSPRSMPAYYQTDPQWSDIDYAGASIGYSGCGLTAAAMSLQWWLRERCTPADLQAAVGDSCTTGGLNDMAKFGAYAQTLGL